MHRQTQCSPHPFGEIDGRPAWLYTLRSEFLTVGITDFAGALVSIEAPDRAGCRGHVVLGFDDAGAYADADGSFGALLGRNANRIAGGHVEIDGVDYRLSTNEDGATLHGGARGFSKQFWRVAAAEPQGLVLALTSPDGDQGFPGQVDVEAAYVLDGARLHLSFTARTTRPTPVSLSAHPYFNLDGIDAGDCLDHMAQFASHRFLPTDGRQLPTGERQDVADGPFDFTQWRPIGERIRQNDAQLRYGRGYDHYFVLPEENAGTLRLAARVRADRSGRTLDVLTTQRGFQFYTGNNLDGSVAGRGGVLYRQSQGFAVEPQGFPDAPHHPEFPSTILRPGELYREEIVYRFGVVDEEVLA